MSSQIPIVYLPSGISRISPDGFESRDPQVGQEIMVHYKREKDKNGKSLILNEKLPRPNPRPEMLSLDRPEEFLQDMAIDEEEKASDCEQDDDDSIGHQEESPRSNSTEPSTANAKTLKTYQSHVRVFKDWLKLEGLPTDFEYCSAEELSSWLKKFYRDGRRKDGQQWKPSSLKIFRFAINQHLNSEPINRSISITRDKQFKEANKVISDRHKELIQLGEDATGSRESKDNARPLTCEDVRQLFDRGVIGVSNPKALHRYVFMILGINFGITTRLALHLLKPCMLYFDQDDNSGLLYVQYDPKRGSNGAEKKKVSGPKRKMYGIPGNPMCPVAALKLYVQKRNPECTGAFFHTPNRHYKETGVWYTPQATGKNTLGKLMKDIAIEGKLSFPYTNHCLRYTPPYVFTPPEPSVLPYRTANGSTGSTTYIQREILPFTNESRPLQVRPTTNAADCGSKLAVSSGIQFNATDGKNYISNSTHYPASVSSMPLLYPPVKRGRGIPPLAVSASSQEDALLIDRDFKSSFVLKNGQEVPENQPKINDKTRAMKAHNVLCVSRQWEMGAIINAINAGDAIVLSRQDVRVGLKNNTQVELTKKSSEGQRKSPYEARDQGIPYLKAEESITKPENYSENHSNGAPQLFKSAPSKFSSRSSRKQLEPKRIRPDEVMTNSDASLQIDVAYDDAITNIQANLTVIEKLQKDYPPSKQIIDELDKIRVRIDLIFSDTYRSTNHVDI